MARTYPAAATMPSLPDTLRAAPTQPIFAGSGTLEGAHYDLVRAYNLAAATGHAAPIISQGHTAFTANTGGWVEQCRYKVPYLSSEHEKAVFCGAVVTSGAGTGELRFTAVNAGNTATITPIGAYGWYSTGAALVLSTGATEEILIESKGDVDVDDVLVSYQDVDSAAAYPAADGQLPAGAFDGYIPFDDADVQADAPMSSDLGRQMIGNLTPLGARKRVIYQYSGVANGPAAADAYMPERGWSVPVPVLPETGPVEVHLRLENVDVVDHVVWIQHGPGYVTETSLRGQRPNAAGPGLTRQVVAAGTALGWLASFEVDLIRSRDLNVSGAFDGFTWFGVFPDDHDQLRVHSVSAWCK